MTSLYNNNSLREGQKEVRAKELYREVAGKASSMSVLCELQVIRPSHHTRDCPLDSSLADPPATTYGALTKSTVGA